MEWKVVLKFQRITYKKAPPTHFIKQYYLKISETLFRSNYERGPYKHYCLACLKAWWITLANPNAAVTVEEKWETVLLNSTLPRV